MTDQTIHFTPTWTTEGEPCELGNGTLIGTWDPEGIRDVDGHELRPAGLRISLEIGSRTRCGTGPWLFSVQGFLVAGVAVQCTALQCGVMEMGGTTVAPHRGDVVPWSEPSNLGAEWPELVLRPALWRSAGRKVGLTRVTALEPWTWSPGDRLSFFVPAESVRVRTHWLFNLPVSQSSRHRESGS